VILTDIAEHLLQRAAKVSPQAKSIHTRAETLTGIDDTSIDFIVALRVFSSFNFNPMTAIRQAKRTLRNEGSVLISVCNGYRAIDDTILPGQVVGTPPYLDFSQPFKEALRLLGLLHKAGFCELFLVPGSTELFLGGTYRPDIKKMRTPILHVEGIDPISLCFFSESMPTAWLGNYSNHPIQLDGFYWPTVEHFFQAQKFTDQNLRRRVIECMSPQSAKSFAWSHNTEVRDDWKTVRLAVMRKGLQAKFEQHPYLKSTLLLTGNRKLIERSPTDYDYFWGRSLDGQGENMMGSLLTEIRSTYKRGLNYEA